MRITQIAITILLFISSALLLTGCSLGGDLEKLRPTQEEYSEPTTQEEYPEPTIMAPDTLTVTASDGLLTARWNAVDGAENYEVYVDTTLNPPVTPLKTVSGTTTVLDSLTNKTTYYVWVKAIAGILSSDFSPHAKGIPWPTGEAPATPERPVIIAGVNQLTITWEASGGAASYEVYINTSPSVPYAPEITTNTTSAVIANLENDVIYYLWVRAVNSAGKSDYSPLESGTPRLPTVAPVTPSQPTLSAGSREIYVSWHIVELASAYEVWTGTSNNSVLAQKYGDDIPGYITETVITGLENETTYHVWLRAKNLIGTSDFSPSANAQPSAFLVLPKTPDVPLVIAGSGELNVSWQATEGALAYEVWTGLSDNPANAAKYGTDITGTSVKLTGLVNGTTYYIWIKAKNNVGTSGFSPGTSATPSVFDAIPSAPAIPVVTEGSGQLAVSWQVVEGATVYEVWTGTTNNSNTATKRGDDISALSTVITGLTNGTTYYVWIKAKNNVGASGFSPMASGTPSVYFAVPQVPSVSLASIGTGQITLSWQAVEGATSYEVWMGTANNSASASKYGEDVSASLSATISGLTNGTTYYFWLKAKNNIGTSGFSPALTARPIANAAAPTLGAGDGHLSISWAAITGAEQYEVLVGTGENPPENVSQTVNAPLTTVTISGLVNGTTYNVWVRGKNSTGTGAISSRTSGKPIGNMGTIALVSGNGQISLSWSTVAGADQYNVYYSTINTIPVSPAQTVSTNTATISGLTNGTTYYVWVQPKNANGTGGISIAINGKPLGTPGAPTITPGYKALLITWAAVAGADEYEVYYGIDSPTILAVTTTETTATITGLTGGITYHVRLRAKNANGVSEYGPSSSNVPDDNRSLGLYRNDVKIGNQNLDAALSYISINAVNGDDYFIVLGADESISPGTLGYSGKTVIITLMSSGGERKITLGSNGSMFTINAGVTLILDENITLVGRSSNNNSLVRVNENSTLIMNDGAKITGNNDNSGSQYGGGIYVYRGIFTMYGGKISGNSADVGGGIFVSSGTMTMYDGTISENTGSDGGGIYISNGTITINDGMISGNKGIVGGGICAYGGTLIMNGGIITRNSSTSGNSLTVGSGGGIFLAGGIFTMNGGKISGNSASVGGGIRIYSSGNTIMHGGIISGNIASSQGGGIETSLGGSFLNVPLLGGEQNSGIIYGSEATGIDTDGIPLGNTATSGSAVYSSSWQRNTTVWETDQIDTTTGKGLSSSGNPPFGE